MMPFSKYLQEEVHNSSEYSQSPPFSHGIQLQIPSFIYNGTPTLAPGGGAEVLPYNSSWATNNGFLNSFSPAMSAPLSTPLPCLSEFVAPSPLGLPVYSASGFDVLSLLSCVATRPNPRIVLGPVDMTCSFVVVDVRRHDHPIVYCSPSFCRLTGYEEHEILGRNCRFLQAPPGGGPIRRGEERRFTSQSAVAIMRKALSADKEVQTSIVNFRKDGSAFINLVSVIPVTGGVNCEKDEVVYHVGFQVDLTEQPNAILEKLKDGTYVPDHHAQRSLSVPPAKGNNSSNHLDPPASHRKVFTLPALTMSTSLTKLLQKPAVLRSFPITTSTTAPLPLPASAHTGTPSLSVATTSAPGLSTSVNSPLSLLLLEYTPDFILVVSLKGAFLYVAPSVTRVLGYTISELVGRSMADLAHPEDVVPLERQLKESSSLLYTGSSISPSAGSEAAREQRQARTIDVLFRAHTKSGAYVWLECRGRLHVEPGKGRKAIILSGRARAMSKVCWGDVVTVGQGLKEEFWASLGGRGPAKGALLGVGKGVSEMLGYEPEEIMGKRLGTLVVAGAAEVERALAEGDEASKLTGKMKDGLTRKVVGRLKTKGGGSISVMMVFYHSASDDSLSQELQVAPAPLLLQVCALDTSLTSVVSTRSKSRKNHLPTENIFAELEVSRGSSWQYELQQLRFANQRLKEELNALENGVHDVELKHNMDEEELAVDDDVQQEYDYTDVDPGQTDQLAPFSAREINIPMFGPLGMGGIRTGMEALSPKANIPSSGGGDRANFNLPLERYGVPVGMRKYTGLSPGGVGNGGGVVRPDDVVPVPQVRDYQLQPLQEEQVQEQVYRTQTPRHGMALHQGDGGRSNFMVNGYPTQPQHGHHHPQLQLQPLHEQQQAVYAPVPQQHQQPAFNFHHNIQSSPQPQHSVYAHNQQQNRHPQPQPPYGDWGSMHPGVKRVHGER